MPSRVLLLGTDASGKNHVASVWAKNLRQLGNTVELREGWLSQRPNASPQAHQKGRFAHHAEALFLWLFPILRWFLPPILAWLIRRDLRRFKDSSNLVMVVSHKALRILAFTLGQRPGFQAKRHVPKYLQRTLTQLATTWGGAIWVLDVDARVRLTRIYQRIQDGVDDPFDRYMVDSLPRSERIENSLVQIAKTFLGAQLLENNQASDAELWQAFLEGIG
jgi:hypothetical protein